MVELVEAGPEGSAHLIGGCCTCGHVFFPFQPYGCEICGRFGDDLAPVPLGSDGVVEASATVHLHADPDLPPPFAVAQVRLDAGPVVRGILGSPHELAQGTRVTGGWAHGSAGPHATAFRFVAIEGAEIG